MSLVICEIHAAPESGLVNQEWIVLENRGTAPVHTRGLRLTIQVPKGRPREVGVIEPGFNLVPGARQRIVSGSPGRKSLGVAPEDETPNYYLFLKAVYIEPSEAVIRIARNQFELAQAVVDSTGNLGVRARS